VTFRLSLDDGPPAGESVTVYVLTDVSQALTQLGLFGLQVQHDGLAPGGGPAPAGDFDFTGSTLELVSGGATVTVPTFDDGADEPPTPVTFSVVPFEDVPWGGDELGADPGDGPLPAG
jgi:hypothetical protein